MMPTKSAVAMNISGVRDPRVDGPQGDAVPFFYKGHYHLYYLEAPVGEFDQPERGRTPWRHIVSDDLVHWEDLGIALPLGKLDEPDSDGIWTGSVIAVGGVIHIFYTGGNRSRETPQTICHATSSDGVNFTKDERNPLFGPDLNRFEARDWRDPFVFWNDERRQYWMLLASRVRVGVPGRRGAIVLCTSPDLESWTIHGEPFYAPGNTWCMECPEVFELGGKWRMIFARFSERAATIYREATSLEGPWRTPAYPALDGARWYAAKSLTDNAGRRIAFGWVHDRRGLTDDGEWLWGGDMCLPREIYVGEGDRLCVRPPQEIENWLRNEVELSSSPLEGGWDGPRTNALGGYASAAIGTRRLSQELCRITLNIFVKDLRGGVGTTLFANAARTDGLDLFLDAGTGQVTLSEVAAGKESDRAPEPSVTGWIDPRSNGNFRVDLYLRGNVLEVFVDIVYAEDGIAEFHASLWTHGEGLR